MTLGGADSAKFTANSNAGTATWAKNTGTLVLTANAAVNANTNIVFTFPIAQPAADQAAVSPTIATVFAAGNLASTALTGSNILAKGTTSSSGFSAQPTAGSITGTGVTISATPNAAVDIKCGVFANGAIAPTAIEVYAGTGNGGAAVGAVVVRFGHQWGVYFMGARYVTLICVLHARILQQKMNFGRVALVLIWTVEGLAGGTKTTEL